MAQEWYIDDGRKVVGPVSSVDLQARALDGRLRPTDRVSPDKAKWKSATLVKGLRFGTKHPTIPAPVPPPPRAALSSDGLMDTLVQDMNADEDTPARESAATDAELAADISGYEMLGVLGSGACGVVYRARQLNLDRVVALKMVQVAGRANSAMISRFEKEAVSLAKLQHPNIVGVFDCGRRGEQVYFAMELLKGEDFGQRIGKVGRVDERTAWAVARQTAAALAHALGEGIYHRDVKPANLFLAPMPTGFGLPPDLPLVKVTDFGLALTRRAGDTTSDARLTAAGVVLGTPVYMAPEQFRTPDVDHRADIYALGATVYHALSGEVPFPGATAWDVMLQKAQGGPPRLGPPVSAESADLVAAMMAPDPDERIGGYEELIQRIDALPVMQGIARTTGSADLPPPKKPVGLLSTAFFVPPSAVATARKSTDDQGRRRKRIAAVAAGVGIPALILFGILLGGGSDGNADTTRRAAANYKTTSYEEHLFDRQSINGWPGVGGAVNVEKDDDGEDVLNIAREARRTYAPVPEHRLTIGLDLFKATQADVAPFLPAATVRDADAAAPRLVLRVRRTAGAILGYVAGADGAFTPLDSATAVPYPTEAEILERGPYPELRFDRLPGRYDVFFNARKVGSAPDGGTQRISELRVRSDGPVRINHALIQGLAPDE